MINTKSIDLLCVLHTNLVEEDIQKIEEVARNLSLIADLNRANVFVDCLTKEGKHAIVVAEAVPATAKSVYNKPVTGKFVYEVFEPAVFFALRTGKEMFLNRALTQEGKTVEQSVVPIRGLNNRVIAALIKEKDISEAIQSQEKMKALSETKETLSELLVGMTGNSSIIPEVIEEALFFVDSQLNILYFNPSAINLVSEACALECKASTPINEYFPCLEDIFLHPDELLIREVEILHKVFQVKKISLGQTNETMVIFRDITELREKERELVVKSVMIREIHHRVKNNLQTVASLLRLQMRRGVPEESKVHFLESLNRILSIASVYEIILSNSSVDDVEIFSLIEKIGNMLVYCEDHENTDIAIEYSGTQFFIESNKAVSVALVINELIQNCVKHAFKGLVEGKIEVSFQYNGHVLEVQVRDNGVGYPEEAKPSLGLEIVKMMIEHDLSGQFTIKRDEKGTIASAKFPLKKGEYGE
ncbi:sensor histidine kinase [Peribacillus asahii]|uniref:histidine kinase n=1 Tax=Peribacillus asahii TaxID=228899 RepID=A0A3Q9RNJ2_9BACI|nr:sensor histidine kinase [Peribacillus asahii]AZV43788.1 histidine kinase [Peribacillus asahii]USK83529.1 sensor histidine kinase [Peribacillus asahii]